MQKKSYSLFITTLILICGCYKLKKEQKPLQPNQTFSYPTRDNQFVVLAVQDRSVTSAQARVAARIEAAHVTLNNGYRYYIIDSELEILVAQDSSYSNDENSDTVYKEVMSKEKFSPGQDQTIYPAIRLLIDCFTQKPAAENSIDAEQYLENFKK